jgi:hypothetical protein
MHKSYFGEIFTRDLCLKQSSCCFSQLVVTSRRSSVLADELHRVSLIDAMAIYILSLIELNYSSSLYNNISS